jgi:hypothetical protein
MNSLVWCVPVTLGGMASAQHGHNGAGVVEVHDVLNCKVAILQNQDAAERIGSMNPETCKIKNVC